MRFNLGGRGWIPYDGYGRMTTGVAKASIYAGHNVYPFELRDLKEKPAWYLQRQGLNFSYMTIQLGPPNEFQHLPGRSISWSMHESMTLPDNWANMVNQCSQLLLVPSPWLIEVFEEGGVKLPIEVVPGGIDPAECPIVMRSADQPFAFGCLADRGNRKGHDLVYSAFYKAFDHKDRNVRLIMKCRPGSLPRLDFSYSSDPRLTVWRADVEHVSDIFSQFDAFMFPSRCEGFGMPPREAAACGVPTVVTRFSGTADDCDNWAVPLEKFNLVESYMEGCGGLWAMPDMDELVWRMQDIYQHQDEYKARALKAAQWQRENGTYAIAAQKLIDTVARHMGGLPAPTIEKAVVKANGHLHEKVTA